MNTTKIVCLCGSTRFFEAFELANYEETMAGHIVLSVGFFGGRLYGNHRPGKETEHGKTFGCTPEQKVKLDELHLRKIDLADETYILNVDGYIGESTQRELAYTIFTHKKLQFLEPQLGEEFMERKAHELGRLLAEFAKEKFQEVIDELPILNK